MDLSSFEAWEIGVHIIEIVAIVILWVNRKGQAATDAVEALGISVNERVDGVQLKVVELDTKLNSVNIAELRKEISLLHGDLKKMEGQMVGVEKALSQLTNIINAGLLNKRANDLAG